MRAAWDRACPDGKTVTSPRDAQTAVAYAEKAAPYGAVGKTTRILAERAAKDGITPIEVGAHRAR
jgi:hypothetical protein